ncbi:DUF2786 domain-containing protein [Leekyejoonella antrihumi]|nr:DUF2786 domain-containing protein [Leekyejoonella antrihumi]
MTDPGPRLGDEDTAGAGFGGPRASSTFGGPAQGPSIEAQVYDLAGRAVRAVDARERERVRTTLARIVERGGGSRIVERVLTTCLRDMLEQAWRSGWEPADLHRLVGKRHKAADQDLLLDAMADQIGRYAEATVDPRWHAQLRELDATSWWPEHRTYLSARGDASWLVTLDSAVTVLGLLGGIPALESLGPPPGGYTQPRHTERAPVDERILSRVRALLAKAESTTFEAEAETFTAGAQALMARHSIDAALLAATHQRDADAPQARRIGVDAPYEAPKALLLTEVAEANRCRTVWSKELGFVTVLGFETDLDAVETLFTSLLVQVTSALSREGTRTYRNGQSRTRTFRQSFLSAFARRIGERLQAVTQEETDAAVAAQSAAGSGSRALVPLLAERSQEVNDSVDEMFPQLKEHAITMGTDYEGWESGRRAADQAALNRGAAVEQRRGA